MLTPCPSEVPRHVRYSARARADGGMSERPLGNNRWAMHWLGSMRRPKTPQEKKWRLSLGTDRATPRRAAAATT
jgi:hypothetical protein